MKRIKRLDRDLKSYTVINNEALIEAQRLTRELKAGKYRGPLHGIPVSVKDLIDTKGIPTTYGSKIFKANRPEKDARVVRSLKQKGAIVIGKTNTHEFGMGNTTPPTKNPWDPERIPGGSSGGSAAALSADLAIFALGTDTSGSIRMPSSMCGTTGLKPTFGKIPFGGIFPGAWSMDHVGPMCRFASDIPILLKAMGYSVRRTIGKPRLTAGLVTNLLSICNKRVRSKVERSADEMASQGLVELEEIEMPDLDVLFQAGEALSLYEAVKIHADLYKQNKKTYLHSSSDLIEEGKKITRADYLKALNVRRNATDRFSKSIYKYNVLICPTCPSIAPLRREAEVFTYEQFLPYLKCVEIFDLVGVPAISLPCGYVNDLPVGVQVVAARGRDDLVIELSAAYQEITSYHIRTPPSIEQFNI